MPPPPVLTGRFAAAELGSTVYDSNDLSTVRGGSLALLEIVRRIDTRLAEAFGPRYRRLSSGASDLVYEIKGDDGQSESRLRTDVAAVLEDARNQFWRLGEGEADVRLADFTFLDAAVSTDAMVALGHGDVASRVAAARAATARQQYSILSVALPERLPASQWMAQPPPRPCAIDRLRPASETVRIGRVKARVSRFTERRRAFGREERERFYNRILEQADAAGAATIKSLGDIGFAVDLGQICVRDEDDDALAGRLRESLHSKICVLYLDGNRFGAAFAAKAGEPEKLAALSADIARRQALLLAAALDWLLGQADLRFTVGEETRLRFQTLLWGGDEMAFVLPAWAAFDFLAAIEPALQNWHPMLGDAELTDEPLTHGVGLVFADRKMPIKLLRDLADEVAVAAKAMYPDAGAQALALEGLDLPETSAVPLRRRLFELPAALDDGAMTAAFQLQLPGETFVAALARWRGLRKALPRTRAHRLLRAIRDKAGNLTEAHHDPGNDFVRKELGRVVSSSAHANEVEKALFDRNNPRYAEARMLPLLTLMHLGDYLDPFKTTDSAS